MTDVGIAKKNGETHLKTMITAVKHSVSYDETAYHLPISFALTGIAVHDQKTALEVFEKTDRNPLVASECILAEKTAAEGREPAPYTGFIDDTVIRKLGYSLVDGSILGLALVVGTPAKCRQCCCHLPGTAGKIHAHVPCPVTLSHHFPMQG